MNSVVSHSRTSEIPSDPYDRVLPQHVRESLVGRPQIAAKTPQVAAKTPQVEPDRETKNVALLAISVLVAVAGMVTLAGWHPSSSAQALPTPIPRLPTPSPAPTVVVTEAVPPRAELIQMPAPRAKLLALPNWRVGQSQLVRMPDGLQVLATLKGSVRSAYDLPLSGNHIGDTYVLGDNSEWVWLTAPGSTQATWIDP